MSIVVGVDLSLTSTGICRITSGAIQLDRVRTKGSTNDTLWATRDRFNRIADRVAAKIVGCDLVVLEGPAMSRTNGHQHDRSGLWWLIADMCMSTQDSTGDEPLQVVSVSPTARARYATGKGNAGKDEVLAAVVRRYPQAEVTGNDAADALILAAMGARHLGEPIEESLAKVNLTAMEAVRWPQ
jgi:crossover junction endodeoxyribonuclease RuvC